MRRIRVLTAVAARTLVALFLTRVAIGQVTIQHVVHQDHFGERVACLGDVDDDGTADFAIAAPNDPERRGAIYVVSGSTLELIYAVRGLDGIQHLGSNMTSGGDVDGDGVLDLLVTNTHGAWGNQPAEYRVNVLSGRNGRCIRTNEAPHDELWWGYSARIIDDIDGDCCAEYAVGTLPVSSDEHALVILFDGKTGARIARWPIEAPGELFVASVASIRDASWSESVQLVIGTTPAPSFYLPTQPVEFHFAVSGGIRAVIQPFVLDRPTFSGQVVAIGDVDGDGCRDIAMTSMRCSSSPVADLEVRSARTGARIWSLRLAEFPPTPDDSLVLGVECVVPCGDIDGDRIPDVIIGNRAAGEGGMVWAYSGRTGTRIYAIRGEFADYLGTSLCVSDSIDDVLRPRNSQEAAPPTAPRILLVACRTFLFLAPKNVDTRSHANLYSLIDGTLIGRVFSDDLHERR